MPDFTQNFENTMKSKAALDAIRAFKLYEELVKSGWPHDEAFMWAFLGIPVFHIPGLKPIPRPDPPSLLPALYEAAQAAHTAVSGLKQDIEADLAFLKERMEGLG